MQNLLFRFGNPMIRRTRIGGSTGLALAALVMFPADISAANANIGFTARVTGERADGLTPMSADIVSFTDEAGLRLFVSNSGSIRTNVSLTVYDANFRRIEARTFPENVSLASGGSSQIIVIVPFEGSKSRDLRICAERLTAGQARRRACGRYTIRHESLD